MALRTSHNGKYGKLFLPFSFLRYSEHLSIGIIQKPLRPSASPLCALCVKKTYYSNYKVTISISTTISPINEPLSQPQLPKTRKF